MKIVFTHGYFLYEDPKELEIMRPYPPLGILYISAWLEKYNFPNEIFDSTFSSFEEQKQYLLNEKPEVVAIYCNLMTKVNVVRLIKFINTTNTLKHTKIVLGGPDVRYNLEDYLSQGADFAIIGEGEKTMFELVENIKAQNPFYDEITGLAYINGNGDVIKNKERLKIREVDELPLPNREGIDMSKYLSVWKKHHGKSTISVSTQRGCPYTCRWCSTAVYGQSYRRRSPEVVVDELLYLKEKFNPDALWFVDDVFTVSHKWLAAFKEEVNKRNAVIPFECITRADRLNPKVLGMLKEAGCFRVWIGAESGSQKIIDAMDRRVKVETVREMIQEAKRQGIEAGTFIMLGYPGETEDDIQETIHHLKVSNPDHFTITIAYPIKGTGLFQEVEAIQTTELDWGNSTDRDRDFERTYSKKYYEYAVRHVVNEVNYNKKKLDNKHLSISGVKMKTKSLLAKSAMRWLRN